MLLDLVYFRGLSLEPVRIEKSIYSSVDEARFAVDRIYMAYSTYMKGLLDLTPIVETDAYFGFDIVKHHNYDEVKSLVEDRLCVWNTETGDVDYAETIRVWEEHLIKHSVTDDWLVKVKNNDLNSPQFMDFHITLTQYLLSR